MKLTHNSIIFLGLTFLLVYPPIAFGGFALGSRTLIQVVTLFLMVVWGWNEIKQGRFPVPGNAFAWSLVVLCCYLIVSAVFSVYPHRSWAEMANVFSYVAIFLLLIGYLRSSSQVRVLLWILVLLGSVLTLYGFAILFLGIPSIFQQIPVHDISHLGGTFPNYNHFAAYLGIIIPMTLSLWWMERTSVRPFILLLILIMVVGMFFTLSRGGILSFVIGMALYVLLLRRVVPNKSTWWVISIIVMVFLFIAGWLVLEPFFERLVGTGGKTAGERFILWKSALVAFSHRPIFGFGLGTFRTIIPAYSLSDEVSFQRHALNDYLEWLTEVGVVGILLTAAVLILMVALIIRRLKVEDLPAHGGQALQHRTIVLGFTVAGFVVLANAVLNFPLHIPAIAIMLAFCAAIPVALAVPGGIFKYVVIPPKKRLRFEIRCVIVLVGIFLAIQVIRPYVANLIVENAHQARQNDDYGNAVKLARLASLWDSKNAEIHDLLGNSYLRNVQPMPTQDKAEAWLQHSKNLALISFDRGVKLNSYEASFHRHRGEVLLEFGRTSEALEAFRQAKHLDRFDYAAPLLMAQAMVAMGDTLSAIQEYRQLLSDNLFFERQILEHALRTLNRVKFVLAILDSTTPRQRLPVAEALEYSNRWEECKALLEDLYTESGDSLVLEKYISSLVRHKEVDRLVEVLEKRLVSRPDDWNQIERLAKAYERAKRFDQATTTYAKLWEHSPDKVNYGNSLGNLLVKTRGYDAAAVIFQKVLQREPNNVDALMGMGISYEYRGLLLDAIPKYQRVLVIQPNHFNGHFHLGASFRRQGMLAQAVEQMKYCLELEPDNLKVQEYLNGIYKELGLDKEIRK